MAELTEVLDVSDGQYRALRVLADGGWHFANRTGSDGKILSTVAAALWRSGMAERRGASRTAKPTNPGFEYRITTKGVRALTKKQAELTGAPWCPTSLTGHPNACRCHAAR